MNNDPSPPTNQDQPAEAIKACCPEMTACMKDGLDQTKAYVRKNPVPILLGAVAFGMAMGCVLAIATRREVTLRERLLDQPLTNFREALHEALAPMNEHLRHDYASVRDMGKTFSHQGNTWADQIGRASRNLKFW